MKFSETTGTNFGKVWVMKANQIKNTVITSTLGRKRSTKEFSSGPMAMKFVRAEMARREVVCVRYVTDYEERFFSGAATGKIHELFDAEMRVMHPIPCFVVRNYPSAP